MRGTVSRPDWFTPQFRGLQTLLFGPDHPELEWDEWRTAAMKRYVDDEGLKSLLKESYAS